MSRPMIGFWGGSSLTDIRTVEANLAPFADPDYPLVFDAFRSRGYRARLDPGVVGIPVGNAGNPEGRWPKACSMFRDEDVTMVQEGRRLSCEISTRFTGLTWPDGQTGNFPVPWNDVVAGWYDQILIDKFAHPHWQAFLASPVMGHPFEVCSEVNIAQGQGNSQVGSGSTPANSPTEFVAAFEYLKAFMEGTRVGASGLVNPYPVPTGKLRFVVCVTQMEFSDGTWEEWVAPSMDILGCDGYTHTTSDQNYERLFQEGVAAARSIDKPFGVFETGCLNSTGLAFKSQWFTDAFTYLSSFTREEFEIAVFTYYGGYQYDNPAGCLEAFADGWTAMLQSDIEPPPPDPPPTGGFVGAISPSARVRMGS